MFALSWQNRHLVTKQNKAKPGKYKVSSSPQTANLKVLTIIETVKKRDYSETKFLFTFNNRISKFIQTEYVHSLARRVPFLSFSLFSSPLPSLPCLLPYLSFFLLPFFLFLSSNTSPTCLWYTLLNCCCWWDSGQIFEFWAPSVSALQGTCDQCPSLDTGHRPGSEWATSVPQRAPM